MSELTVRINDSLYYGDMSKLQSRLFGAAAFKNRKKKAKPGNNIPQIHNIKLVDEINKNEVILFVRDVDLYTVGFRGKDKKLSYVFSDFADLAKKYKGEDFNPATCITYVKSSYTGKGGLQLFSNNNKLKQHTLGSILNAIKNIQNYDGGSFNNLKIDIGILIFVISEALRFVNVRERINQVICHTKSNPEHLHTPTTIQKDNKGNAVLDKENNLKFGAGGGGSFYFKEFEKDVNDWATKSASNSEEDQSALHVPHNR